METVVEWKSQMSFTANTRGHETKIDAGLSSGGLNQAPNPKELVLAGLAGCSGMDVIYFLKKNGLEPLSLSLVTRAEMTKATPSYFGKIDIIFKLIGDNLQKDEVTKAVSVSMNKYCGVALMLSKVCPIQYSIDLNGEVIFNGTAQFL